MVVHKQFMRLLFLLCFKEKKILTFSFFFVNLKKIKKIHLVDEKVSNQKSALTPSKTFFTERYIHKKKFVSLYEIEKNDSEIFRLM